MSVRNQLIDMGFGEDMVDLAVASCGNDIEQALAILTSESWLEAPRTSRLQQLAKAKRANLCEAKP